MELNSCTEQQMRERGLETFYERLLKHRPFQSLNEVLELPGAEGFPELQSCWVTPSDVFVSGKRLQCYENVKLWLPKAVLSASFGALQGPWFDCSDQVRRLVAAGHPVITSLGDLGCDPAPGEPRKIIVSLHSFMESKATHLQSM